MRLNKHATLCSHSDNELITLPPSLMELSSLRTLRLSGNWQLCGLPPGPGALTGLELLDITGTGVAALPPWLGQLKVMQELLAGSNDLQVSKDHAADMQHCNHDRQSL